ncbi:hypothetical protein SDC9_123804 [bioreactor metagenome]|uniref:Uncharacterized protein n=1 Tax=bioreactor metagenome TaxID=1076179 RepID=A0A645CIM9_9ZZZZ
MSTSTTQVMCLRLMLYMKLAMASSADLLGRKPLLLERNLASQIGSSTCNMHCWSILSQIVGIPKGLVFPLGFGISTLRTGFGLYQLNFFLTTSMTSSADKLSTSAIVKSSVPGVFAPLFPLTFRYAKRIFSGQTINLERLLKFIPALLCSYRAWRTPSMLYIWVCTFFRFCFCGSVRLRALLTEHHPISQG